MKALDEDMKRIMMPKHPFEGMRHLVPEPLPVTLLNKETLPVTLVTDVLPVTLLNTCAVFSEDEEEYPEDGYWFPLP